MQSTEMEVGSSLGWRLSWVTRPRGLGQISCSQQWPGWWEGGQGRQLSRLWVRDSGVAVDLRSHPWMAYLVPEKEASEEGALSAASWGPLIPGAGQEAQCGWGSPHLCCRAGPRSPCPELKQLLPAPQAGESDPGLGGLGPGDHKATECLQRSLMVVKFLENTRPRLRNISLEQFKVCLPTFQTPEELGLYLRLPPAGQTGLCKEPPPGYARRL